MGLFRAATEAAERFTYGGFASIVQKVFYINTREIMGVEFEGKGWVTMCSLNSCGLQGDCSPLLK